MFERKKSSSTEETSATEQVISDGVKYDVIKRILQGWDQSSRDFKPGVNDLAIARLVNVPEVEVRTIRWETVGDTRAEREKLEHRSRNAKKLVRSAAQNLERVSELTNALIEEAEARSATWAEIVEAAVNLSSSFEKMPDALEASPTESIALEAIAYRNLTAIWDALISMEPSSKAQRQIRQIGDAIGWLPEETPRKDED